MRSVTPASLSGSQGTREIWLLMGLQVRGKSDVLRRNMSDNCFDRFFLVRVAGEIMENSVGKVGQDELIVSHTVGDNANPGSCGPQ
jgi:hypothetical protein